jgi:hypothetical protein
LPATVELRCREEIVDSVTVESPEADCGVLAADLLESSATDAADEGKTRVYTLVGITSAGERYVCPLRIRRRVDKSAGELLATLAKQNTTLHECLVRKDKAAAELLLQYAQTVAADRERLVDENAEHRKRVGETIDKLESLRSQALERDLALEKHRSELDMRERLTDAAIPLGMAIAHRLTGGAVPSDMPSSMFVEVVKSLSVAQLDSIRDILGERWPGLNVLLTDALSGRGNVVDFRALVGGLPQEQVTALTQALNMGQQAALKEILNGSN